MLCSFYQITECDSNSDCSYLKTVHSTTDTVKLEAVQRILSDQLFFIQFLQHLKKKYIYMYIYIHYMRRK